MLQSSSTAISCKAGEPPAFSHTKVRLLLSWSRQLCKEESKSAESAPCMRVPPHASMVLQNTAEWKDPRAQFNPHPSMAPSNLSNGSFPACVCSTSFLCPGRRKTQVSVGKATANVAFGCPHASTGHLVTGQDILGDQSPGYRGDRPAGSLCGLLPRQSADTYVYPLSL